MKIVDILAVLDFAFPFFLHEIWLNWERPDAVELTNSFEVSFS